MSDDLKGLYKTTVVIWTDFDGETVELETLAREATSGGGYCVKQDSVLVPWVDLRDDPDGWDSMAEFFNLDEDEDGMITGEAAYE